MRTKGYNHGSIVFYHLWQYTPSWNSTVLWHAKTRRKLLATDCCPARLEVFFTDMFISEKPRLTILRLLRKIRYPGDQYHNRYSRALWVVLGRLHENSSIASVTLAAAHKPCLLATGQTKRGWRCAHKIRGNSSFLCDRTDLTLHLIERRDLIFCSYLVEFDDSWLHHYLRFPAVLRSV